MFWELFSNSDLLLPFLIQQKPNYGIFLKSYSNICSIRQERMKSIEINLPNLNDERKTF